MSDERVDKNQVFSKELHQASVEAANPGIEKRTAAEAVKSEFGLEIPVEIVPLPSKGVVYPINHPFHNVEDVEITAMTTREEDILTSQALIKRGTVITELVKSCLLNKDVDVDSLLSGDRNALMVGIRITGYGSDYDGEVKCGACQATTTRKFNLSKLGIKSLSIQPVQPGQNLFEFHLPRTKKTVKFKFLTVADEVEMSTTQERRKKMLNIQTDNNVTTALLYSIVSVDNVTDRAKISRFVSMMPASDSQALRKYMKDNEPGMNMKSWSECSACDHQEEVSLPMGAKFLWPNAE